MTEPLRRPVLHPRHADLGAKLAAFGGWEMPLEYAGGGVLKEHAAVREAVGVFDVSHLGKVSVRGPWSARFVNWCLTNDLDRIADGQAQYTLCFDDATGGVVDDLIAYRIGDHRVLLVPNAANTAEVAARLAAQAPPDVQVINQHEEYAILAAQGPRSADVLAALGLLRTEMGYPLHGQDLSLEITPVQAGSGWAVGWSKPQFWGRDVLLAEKAAGPRRRLRGLEALDRGIPRPGMTVLRGDSPVGTVTSGTFSPTRRIGIGLALLDTAAGLDDGDEVEVDVRGRRSRARVVKPPFVKPGVR